MLSKKVIDKILKSGFYFKEQFDDEKKIIIMTDVIRENFRQGLGIKNTDTAFVDFYSFAVGGCGPKENADCLYTLEEIINDYKNPFWKDQYPNLSDRYLRISSIEGEGSYFYDKETDAVYDVDWNQMDDFVAGKLKPKFNSFYDFLEWYYDEDRDSGVR